MDPLMASLGRDLRRRMRYWPREMSHALRSYLAPWQDRRRRERGLRMQPPAYWYVLPKMLWNLYRRQGATTGTRASFLRDVLLGQYCLFLSVRIQDDLLDGQVASSGNLVFVANRLLVEAQQAFAKHFPGSSPFWRIYENCLRTTILGIFSVERLQQKPVQRPQNLLKEYAHVASLFKVGMAAVCVKARRMNDYARVARCADGLAVFGQILDDLEDVGEDLARGRFNYCSAVLLPRARGYRLRRDGLLSLIGKELLLGNGTTQISRALREQIDGAVEAGGPLDVPGLLSYVQLHQSYAEQINRAFQAWRVRTVFQRWWDAGPVASSKNL